MRLGLTKFTLYFFINIILAGEGELNRVFGGGGRFKINV